VQVDSRLARTLLLQLVSKPNLKPFPREVKQMTKRNWIHTPHPPLLPPPTLSTLPLRCHPRPNRLTTDNPVPAFTLTQLPTQFSHQRPPPSPHCPPLLNSPDPHPPPAPALPVRTWAARSQEERSTASFSDSTPLSPAHRTLHYFTLLCPSLLCRPRLRSDRQNLHPKRDDSTCSSSW